jgi:hypothetical protein
MQAAESRPRDDLTAAGRRKRYCSAAGGVLPESKMSPVFVIVANVIFHQPPQMPLVQNNDVVQ